WSPRSGRHRALPRRATTGPCDRGYWPREAAEANPRERTTGRGIPPQPVVTGSPDHRITDGSLDLLQIREGDDVVRGLDRHHLGEVRGVVAGVVALASGLERSGEPDRVAGSELERGVVQRVALLDEG